MSSYSLCLLRVILDKSLTFHVHTKKLSPSLTSNLYALPVTTHKFWGCQRSTLKINFHKVICSRLDYVAQVTQVCLLNELHEGTTAPLISFFNLHHAHGWFAKGVS